MKNTLVNGARTVLIECLNIKPFEKILILADKKMLKIAKVLYNTAKEINAKTVLMVMEPTGSNGAEPPKIVAKTMKSSDVVIAVTYFSLSHTNARRNATAAGARIATMPRVTELSFTKGGLTANYNQVKQLSEKMFNEIKDAEFVEVKSKNGTDISFSIKNMKKEMDTGIYHNPGDFGNLPAGEAETAPDECSANGIIVFDYFGNWGKNVKLTVVDGMVEEVKNSKKLEDAFKKFDNKARNVAEFSFGTNPKAKLINNALEYEKIFGTVHFALGNNMSYGGSVNVPFHEDGLILKPTVKVDNKIVVENGKWKV